MPPPLGQGHRTKVGNQLSKGKKMVLIRTWVVLGILLAFANCVSPSSAVPQKEPPSGLNWLVRHQLPDGGWSFDHTASPGCNGKCGNPGSATKARRGATSLALLAFFSRGYSHKKGRYRTTVRKGLDFLVSSMKPDENGGNFCEPQGQMFSHSLGALALCQAFSMTHDVELIQPVRVAIDFTRNAQGDDGGWPFSPKQPDNTSVIDWQMMVLKAGHLAYFASSPLEYERAEGFLDKVQWDHGARYAYRTPAGNHKASTASGLYCRLLHGWPKDHPAIQRGADAISDWGPSDDVHYNYFATQLLHHIGGDRWEKWYSAVSRRTVEAQAKDGHEEGSWYIANEPTGGTALDEDRLTKVAFGHEQGGRLYQTAMNEMILAVRYRRMTIHWKDALGPFPEE